jgi:hypothetical protein
VLAHEQGDITAAFTLPVMEAAHSPEALIPVLQTVLSNIQLNVIFNYYFSSIRQFTKRFVALFLVKNICKLRVFDFMKYTYILEMYKTKNIQM